MIERLCRLRRESYADFSIQHFWEKATEEHGFELRTPGPGWSCRQPAWPRRLRAADATGASVNAGR